MSARRCSSCSVNFPGRSAYNPCPLCGEPTDYLSNDDPHDDAEDRARFADLEKWCRENGRSDPLSGDALNHALQSKGDEPLDWSKYQLEQIAELEGIPVLDDDPA
jgi:hypothetical protein